MALPLLVGAPGAMELLVVLLVSLLLFSPLVALAYVTLFRPDRVDESRLDDLETEVSRLRARLDDARHRWRDARERLEGLEAHRFLSA